MSEVVHKKESDYEKQINEISLLEDTRDFLLSFYSYLVPKYVMSPQRM